MHHAPDGPRIHTVRLRHRVAQHTVPGFRTQRWAALSQLARESAAGCGEARASSACPPLAPARQRTVRTTGYESTGRDASRSVYGTQHPIRIRVHPFSTYITHAALELDSTSIKQTPGNCSARREDGQTDRRTSRAWAQAPGRSSSYRFFPLVPVPSDTLSYLHVPVLAACCWSRTVTVTVRSEQHLHTVRSQLPIKEIGT